MTNTALRSWWTLVAGTCLGLSAAVVTLDRIQPSFVAIARIRADDLSERLAEIRAALLAEDSLTEVVTRTRPASARDDALPGLVRTVRARIALAVDEAQGPGVEALELRYRDTDARRAADTVNTLAQIYLDRHPRPLSGTLEAAVVPTVSFSPDPLLIYGVFLVLGCVLFAGPVVARGVLHPVIATTAEFSALSEIPVLGSIPAATTEDHKSANRRRLLKNVALSLLSFGILAGAFVVAGVG